MISCICCLWPFVVTLFCGFVVGVGMVFVEV